MSKKIISADVLAAKFRADFEAGKAEELDAWEDFETFVAGLRTSVARKILQLAREEGAESDDPVGDLALFYFENVFPSSHHISSKKEEGVVFFEYMCFMNDHYCYAVRMCYFDSELSVACDLPPLSLSSGLFSGGFECLEGEFIKKGIDIDRLYDELQILNKLIFPKPLK